MFMEFDRLHILEGEFFEDDKAIESKKKLKADPEIKAAFDKNVETAQTLAKAALAKNPNDQNALFAYSVATGVQMDYASLVAKRGLTSLSYAKEAQGFTHRLLQLNPKFVDAYLTKGFSQYLLSSLPFFVRWFVHFDGAEPDKQAGIENLVRVANHGHYFKAYAKILLAIIYLREKQPERSAKLLTELSKEYPENPLLPKELSKIEEAMARGDFGQRGTT
jgi:tetratricopeptide (TPR) repeat protein